MLAEKVGILKAIVAKERLTPEIAAGLPGVVSYIPLCFGVIIQSILKDTGT